MQPETFPSVMSRYMSYKCNNRELNGICGVLSMGISWPLNKLHDITEGERYIMLNQRKGII